MKAVSSQWYTGEEGSCLASNGRLYGRSGNDSSELTITALTNLEMSLNGHSVLFIQPGSDIECLLRTNVLPQLGVKFLEPSVLQN